MTVPVVGVRRQGDDAVVVLRSPAVDDFAWQQLTAFWTGSSVDSRDEIVIPVEAFLDQRSNFAQRLRSLRIGADLDHEVKALAERSRAEREQLRAAMSEPVEMPAAEVERLVGGSRFRDEDLRPFQTRDLQRLLSGPNHHGANFSVPGAGKTAVTLAVYEAERMRGRVTRLLVIAPLSAFESWEAEVALWLDPAPDVYRYEEGRVPANAEIVVVNYHRLASRFDQLAEWVSAAPTMVVLDEAHRMKRGWRGEWGRACLNLAYRAVRRDILTGTPAPQSPRDLVALIDFLWPNQAVRVIPPDALVTNPPPDAMTRVANAIRLLFVRTNKEDLDLPPVTKAVLEVPLADLHAQIYDALLDQYVGLAPLGHRERLDFIRLGRVVMYLLEAATNPMLLTAGSLADSDPEIFYHPPLEIPPGSRLADLLRDYNRYERPAKFVQLDRLLRRNAALGRKTLVWSNFVRNLLTLERELAWAKPALVHGGVTPYSPDPGLRTRGSDIARFRTDPDCMVLLANPAAMSEGISLHRECHDAIYLDRTFNAGQYLQSIDRIHRLGLAPDQETRITFLLSVDTIDEVVDQRVRVKAERLGEMLDDRNLASVALPNEEEYGPPIDDEADEAALMAHLRGHDVSR